MERRREQVLCLLWWAAMAGAGWLVLRYALVWLLPFLLALGAAALLEPLIVRAQRRLHLRRSFTAAVLTLVLVGGVLAVLIALAVQLVEQAVALVSSLPELLAALPETMASLERRLEGFCAACPDGVRQTAEHMLDSLPRRAAELAGQVSSAVLQGAGRAMAALPRVLLACGTTVLAVFFTLSAYPAVRGFFRRQLGSRLERARE
ncbi:MAG: AI-2E family transporter [Oscillospiraceae bacterium]